jgi:CRP-like cAMP-binding protein
MQVAAEIVSVLREIPVLAAIDESVLGKLAAIARIVEIPKGTLLFSEGERRTDLYFVLSGTIELDMVTAKCGKQRILTLADGDLLAWSAWLGDGQMTASAVATEDTRLLSFPADQLRALCEANHDVGYVVALGTAKLISRRLLATRLQLLDLYHTE